MSGSSSVDSCPECDSVNMHVYSDWKPIDSVSGICMDCGFHYETVTGHYRLTTVNQLRKDYGREPIAKLRKRVRTL